MYKSGMCKSEGIIEDCPGIEINDQSLEFKEKFCYLSDTVGTRGDAFDSDITRISRRSKLRDLVPLLVSRCLHYATWNCDFTS